MPINSGASGGENHYGTAPARSLPGIGLGLIIAALAALVLVAGVFFVLRSRHHGEQSGAITASAPAATASKAMATDDQGVSKHVLTTTLQTNAVPAPTAVADQTNSGTPQSPATEDDQLKAVALSAPAGDLVPPKTVPGQRFSDQVLELMRATTFDGPVPAEVTNRLSLSSDPLVRQIALLEKDVAKQQAHLVQLQKDLPNLANDSAANMLGHLLGQSIFGPSHMETRLEDHGEQIYGDDLRHTEDTLKDGRWVRQVEVQVADPPDAAEVKRISDIGAPYRAAYDDALSTQYAKCYSIKKLVSKLRAVAVEVKPDTHPAGEISASLADEMKTVGNIVVKNQSATTFHHCLIVVQSEEVPASHQGTGILAGLDRALKDQSADADTRRTDALVAQLERMPAISFTYRETMAPGDQILAPACMSGNICFIKTASASFWSDEAGFEGIGVDNLQKAAHILFILQNQQIAEAKQAELKAQEDAKQARLKREQDALQAASAQRKSVYVTSGNGIVLYQILAYPGIWSEPVAAPDSMKHIRVAWGDGARVLMQLDNQSEDPKKPVCAPGSKLRFRAVGDKPVPVAVRFVSREYTADEEGVFILPPYPPPPPTALSSERQARHDALVAMVSKGDVLEGTASENGRRDPFAIQAQITWDGASGEAAGWILFKEPKARKSVEGRIIDDVDTGPVLQLVETGTIDPVSSGNALVGMVYSLSLAENTPGTVTIQKAVYGDPLTNRVVDVTEQVKSQVKGHSLQLAVSRQRFPDPAPRVVKTLSVDCVGVDGKMMTTTAKQGENLTIDNIRVAPLGALTGSWTYRANTAARYGQQFHSGYVILNPNSAAQNP